MKILLIIVLLGTVVSAQTTAFNFQGRLNDGSTPANGTYDFQYTLFGSITGGSPLFSPLVRPNQQVIDGVFSTVLDFGPGAFASGNRFLEIGVRRSGSGNAFVLLGARQQIMSVPIAGYAASAASATSATNAQTASNALALGNILPSGYARLNVENSGNLVATNVGSLGVLQVQGNATQPAATNGFPKMMLAITASGAVARCYNGVTGESTGICGLIDIGINIPHTGVYTIVFPFAVSNRFWLASNNEVPGVPDALTTTITPLSNPNALRVSTFQDGSPTPLPFHLFIF